LFIGFGRSGFLFTYAYLNLRETSDDFTEWLLEGFKRPKLGPQRILAAVPSQWANI
jgi:hypothetical protein